MAELVVGVDLVFSNRFPGRGPGGDLVISIGDFGEVLGE